MSLLTLIQGAATRLGLNSPTTAYASTDAQIIQLVALAQQEGIELMRRYPWPCLTKEKTFTATASAAQSGALPSDFDRFVDETFYDRTNKRPVYGPISPQDWQFTQAIVASTLTKSFRLRGTDILITPTPAGTETFAYEYISNQWCESSGGTDQSAWAADADTGILDEEVMKLGVIWRFLRAKGFDYAEPFRTYELAAGDKFSRQGGRARLSFGQQNMRGYPRAPYVSEGSWNL